jgi:hypothetical protein
MGAKPIFTYTLSEGLGALHDFRTELRAWLARVGTDRDEAEDLVLAAWEVCANAIEHPSIRTAQSRVEAWATDGSGASRSATPAPDGAERPAVSGWLAAPRGRWSTGCRS